MKRPLLTVVVVLGWVAGAGLTPVAAVTDGHEANAVDAGNLAVQTDEGEFPPGINESGVTDPLALVEAHRATLQNASYTMTSTSTYRASNGTVFSQGTMTLRIAEGGDSYYAVSTQASENGTKTLGVDRYRLEVWANATDAAVARNYPGNETSYGLPARSDAPMSPRTGWELLYAAFGTVDTEYVGEVERDGTTLHKVVSTEPTDEAVTGEAYDFTALVDSDGVVRTFQMTQRTTRDGEPVTVTRTVRFTQIGNTTVEQPDWYGQATENESENGEE